mgnify:CR=1 FL=1
MLKPLGEYVLIAPDKQEDKTEGGIILPEMKKDQSQTGIVLYDIDYYTKKGTRVWFKLWAGEPIKYEGVNYLLVHKKDIVAYEKGGENNA